MSPRSARNPPFPAACPSRPKRSSCPAGTAPCCSCFFAGVDRLLFSVRPNTMRPRLPRNPPFPAACPSRPKRPSCPAGTAPRCSCFFAGADRLLFSARPNIPIPLRPLSFHRQRHRPSRCRSLNPKQRQPDAVSAFLLFRPILQSRTPAPSLLSHLATLLFYHISL